MVPAFKLLCQWHSPFLVLFCSIWFKWLLSWPCAAPKNYLNGFIGMTYLKYKIARTTDAMKNNAATQPREASKGNVGAAWISAWNSAGGLSVHSTNRAPPKKAKHHNEISNRWQVHLNMLAQRQVCIHSEHSRKRQVQWVFCTVYNSIEELDVLRSSKHLPLGSAYRKYFLCTNLTDLLKTWKLIYGNSSIYCEKLITGRQNWQFSKRLTWLKHI